LVEVLAISVITELHSQISRTPSLEAQDLEKKFLSKIRSRVISFNEHIG